MNDHIRAAVSDVEQLACSLHAANAYCAVCQEEINLPLGGYRSASLHLLLVQWNRKALMPISIVSRGNVMLPLPLPCG